MDAGLIWILTGLLALGAELLLPGVYLVWVGVAAVATGLVLLTVAPGFGLTVLLFVALLGAGIAASLALKHRQNALGRRVNAPEAGLAGRQATLMAVDAGTLRVRLGDSDWPARMADGAGTPAIGSPLRVEGVDGTVLIVRPG